MDGRRDAGRASASEGGSTMADQATSLRRCIGSARFEIEPHEAPVDDFPKQPSQKDGLGRMCKTHWNQYTAGLARDAKARKAAEPNVDEAPAADPEAAAQPDAKATPKPKRTRATAEAVEAPPDEVA
jgi:hypothetical protein